MRKTLLSLATAALALASASAFADFVPFTVNDGVVPGTTVTAPFVADKISGSYSELLGLTSATTFSVSAVGNLTAYYTNNGQTLVTNTNMSGSSVHADDYKIYALFTATGTATSNTTFIGTGGHLQVWLDAGSNTTFNLPGQTGFNDFTSFATAGGDTSDDILIGESNVSYGSGDLIGPPGAFNIYFKNFLLTSFGQTYWTGLDTMQFVLQTNGDIDQISPNPAASAPPYALSGDFSANFALPEPGSIMLVGVSLLGLGFASRRRQAK